MLKSIFETDEYLTKRFYIQLPYLMPDNITPVVIEVTPRAAKQLISRGIYRVVIGNNAVNKNFSDKKEFDLTPIIQAEQNVKFQADEPRL